MSNILLMRPIVPADVYSNTPGDNAPALRTPNPRETYRSIPLGTGQGPTIVVDAGSQVSADTFYLGWTTCPADDPDFGFVIGYSNSPDQSSATYFVQRPIVNPIGDTQHCIATVPAPVVGRYFFLIPTIGAQGNHPVSVGVVAIGMAFRPQWNQDLGAGRLVGDTGTADRLSGGDFAIEEGATFGGYQWTLSNLSDPERDQLYALARRAGNTRSVLVVEDPDADAGLNERVHWGLLAKLDAYERIDPANTRWALRIDDWA